MKLFIGNIPGTALIVDIHRFLGGLDLRADFKTRQGQRRDSECYHYVVAELEPGADLEALVCRFNGIVFQGQPLAVRPFMERDPCSAWQGEEQRVNTA